MSRPSHQPYYRQLIHRYLRPDMIHESIHDIDFSRLRDDGIRHLFFDVDNTLISYNEQDVSLPCLNRFNAIQAIGFDTIMLVSNNSRASRIERVAQQLKQPAVSFSCKPFVFTLRRILHDRGIQPNQSALIGDQIMTDMLLANHMGMASIFVDPLQKTGVSLGKSLQYHIQDRILTMF